jgi:hypothetical protein
MGDAEKSEFYFMNFRQSGLPHCGKIVVSHA